MNDATKNLSDFFLRQTYKLLFRPLFGWQGGPIEGTHRTLVGARDGSRLEVAWRESAESTSRGVIVLCHPFLKYGMHYFARSGLHTALAAAGFHVVLFNFKGFGNSISGGYRFSTDVLSITDWIKARWPGLPIVHVGCSFGAYHLAHAMAADADCFTNVVFDSAPRTVQRFFKRGLQGKIMRWLGASSWAEPTGTIAIDSSLRRVPRHRPIYAYGVDDEYIDGEDLRVLRASCPGLQLVPFEACGHLGLYKKDPDKYLAMITESVAPLASAVAV